MKTTQITTHKLHRSTNPRSMTIQKSEKKRHIMEGGVKTTNFSSIAALARSNEVILSKYSKEKKKKNCKPRILYPAKISIKSKNEIKTFFRQIKVEKINYQKLAVKVY